MFVAVNELVNALLSSFDVTTSAFLSEHYLTSKSCTMRNDLTIGSHVHVNALIFYDIVSLSSEAWFKIVRSQTRVQLNQVHP